MKIKHEHKKSALTHAASEASFRAVLSGKGRKVTGPRLEILKYMMKKGGHMTAEQVYAGLQSRKLGRATVFRALRLFLELGLVEKNAVGSQNFFEVKNSSHHHHMACVSCGRLIEFTDDFNESFLRSAAARNGFKIYGHRLELWGLCRDCGGAK